MPSSKAAGMTAVGAVVLAIALAACASGQSSPSSHSSGAAAGGPGSSGGTSNARSGPAAGGTAGTVDTVSAGSFTLSTATGETVTVNEDSSTTYQQATSSASPSAITTGTTVLVLGMVNSTTITATQVTVQPTGDYGSAASAAAGVVPFTQGAQSPAKQVGQIPDYTEGSGTIVGGTTADQATEAALAAYPGGVIDRVVLLTGGEYEVHNIGVNWPHHVFVDQSFAVVGAN